MIYTAGWDNEEKVFHIVEEDHINDALHGIDVLISRTQQGTKEYSGFLGDPYYWCVKRTNGKMFPLPLLFETEQVREEEKEKYISSLWDSFYRGHMSSIEVKTELANIASEEELLLLKKQVLDWYQNEKGEWDDLVA